jgi:hypothetical protein
VSLHRTVLCLGVLFFRLGTCASRRSILKHRSCDGIIIRKKKGLLYVCGMVWVSTVCHDPDFNDRISTSTDTFNKFT